MPAAEHQGLPPHRQLGDDPLDVVDKAHVQHPVGLVQHKDLDAGQVHIPLPDQVVQAAGAGHQDVDPLFQLFDLRGLAHAAEDDGRPQLEELPVLHKALLDLEGQLPGGGQDEGADGPRFFGRAGAQQIQHGQGEGRRLAGAGLGTAQQVLPFQHRGNGPRLDGRRLFIARPGHGPQDGFG